MHTAIIKQETTRDRQGRKPIAGKSPVISCPVCDAKALTRTSEEITPVYRRLYYFCTNLECGMTWRAALVFEDVISPSAISNEFRPAREPKEKAPGHDFGQLNIFQLLPPAPPD